MPNKLTVQVPNYKSLAYSFTSFKYDYKALV